ncbi:F-box/LRR-repeat protein At5g02910-like [Castanea sativa]|uniref:F-box/LRR-repeat protein At5g02910-like n=1 Tax=Castanea sativa TaxID=21020 RepID=UPI003F64E297
MSIERHMMDEKIDVVDRTSDLPEFILHHILSFLPRKEATKICLLSKKWNCVWSSFPILDFDQALGKGYIMPDMSPDNQERVEKFMNNVDTSLSRFHEHNLKMQKFELHMTLVDFKLASLVDKWIELAFEHDAQEIGFQVLTEKNSWYTFPRTIFVAKSTNGCKLEQPCTWSAVKFYSLQKLVLGYICVNEEIIQDIIRCCPFITDFSIIGCHGLKNLEISKLPKLCKVEVVPLEQQVENIKVEAANLQHFSFTYSRQRQCSLDITACQNLKELYLTDLSITDQNLHFNISRFPHLETLEVSGCIMLERVKISAQRLRMLTFEACQKLLELEIDSPNLSSFKFLSLENVFPTIVPKNAPCPFELTIVLDNLIDTLWFLKLREFLVMSNQRKVLKLIVICDEVTFNLEDLRGITLPPSFELELMMLDVRMSALSIDYGSLIDGLLWSCRPKQLSLPTGLKSRKKCIKVLCEDILDKENRDCSCCWRHHFKGAKIKSIAGIEDEKLLDCKTLLDTLPTLGKGQEIQFRLD